MRNELILKKIILTSFCAGVAGAVLYIFFFPGGAVSTLMHEVLNLPGPGAGIGFVSGPFLIFFVLGSVQVHKRAGFGWITALFYTITISLAVNAIGIYPEGKGRFGSLESVIGMIGCGLSVDLFFWIFRKMKFFLRVLLSVFCANLLFLIYHWTAIFPQTAGWIKPENIPVLILISALGAALCALFVYIFHRFKLFAIIDFHDSKEN
jgi:hypothetical protein